MFYYCPDTSYMTRVSKPESYIRFLNALPNSENVDIYLNNKLFANSLSYRGFTKYFSIMPGTYNIKIFNAGSKTKPLVNRRIYIKNNTILTAPIFGDIKDPSFGIVNDYYIPTPQGDLGIKVVDLSLDLPNINVGLSHYENLFSNVSYGKVTSYKLIEPGTYTINITSTDGNEHLLTAPNMTLKPNRYYSIYVIGSHTGKPSLQVLVPLDGNSYIKF